MFVLKREKLTYLRYYYINDALSILIADAIEGMLMLKRNLLLPWAIDPRSSHIKTFDLPFMNENEDVQMNIDPKSSHIKAFDLPFMNENENAQMNIDEDDISNIDHDDFARISWYSHKLPITIKYQQNNIEIKKQLPASFEYFCGLLAGISISGANITASIFDYDITDMDSGLFRKLFMFQGEHVFTVVIKSCKYNYKFICANHRQEFIAGFTSMKNIN